MNDIWKEIWNTSLGLEPDTEIAIATPCDLEPDAEIAKITSEPTDDAITNKIWNEIFIISLGGSTSEEKQEKQEKSNDQTALTSPPHKATATVVSPTSIAHIRHYLKKTDIERLQPLQWLNEELISFGIRMIRQKSIISHSVIAFSTFFMEKIQRDGLYAIGKWHARIDDPFSKDILFFPIHINGNHWYLQVIIIHRPPVSSIEQTASLFILDSLGYKADHKIHVDFILSYLRFYWPHLKGIDIHSSKVPQQPNSSDCGIYVIYFCKVLCTRNLQLSVRVLKGDKDLNAEEITMYWDIKKASQIRSWLLQCVKECAP